MPVYPIEISEKLTQKLQSPLLAESVSLTDHPQTLEEQWVAAIVSLESGDRNSAKTYFNKITQQQTLESVLETTMTNKSQQIVISSFAELLLIEPMQHFTDKPLIKQLRKLESGLAKDRLRARLCHALAIVMLWRRDTNQALNFLFQSREIYSLLSEDLGSAYIADTLGSVFSNLADHQQALLYYSESLALKTDLADHQGRAITLGNLARLCLQMGRYEQASRFALLDFKLCANEPAATRARVLNLLARISTAAQQWQTAQGYLSEAIALHHANDFDGLFFCHKDLLNMRLEKGDLLTLEDLQTLQVYLPQLSSYHQLHFDILKRKIEQRLNVLEFTTAEKTLEDIQSQNIPEVELDFRVWLCRVAFEKQLSTLAKSHLLLARKLAKKYGLKRYSTAINSLMLQYDVHENIVEEIHRPIVESAAEVEDGYLIRKKLGQGGYGSVYLAHDMIKDRDVALKKFHFEDHWEHKEFQQKWNQARLEFEAVAGLKHPAVAETYALGHDNFGSPYLVQEYLCGGELRGLMGQTQDLKTVLTYLIPIVQGLRAIHQAGVIHRDLKPENILLNAQGMPVIVDFGIAVLKHAPNQSAGIQGSINYTAPEQKKSSNIDHRADLYSIGCIMYEWLTGTSPESSHKKVSKLGQWFGGQSNPKIDKTECGEATQLLQSLLNSEPTKRPLSADELLVKLKSLKP